MPEMRRPMRLGEAIYNALTGRSPKTEGKGTTQQRAQELMKRHGTTAKVAAAVGVAQRTVQRWLKGTQEAKNTARARNADKLTNAQRAARITPGRAKAFAGSAKAPGPGATGTGGLSIYGTVRVSADVRTREIKPGAYIPQGELDRVIEKLAADGPDAAAGELNRLVSTYYVPGMQIETVEAIDYD